MDKVSKSVTSRAVGTMKRLLSRTSKDQDFSKILADTPKTRKQRLQEECRRRDVSIYADDPTEQSAGVASLFRNPASEAELERRLNSKRAVGLAGKANVIAVLALVVSVAALVKAFW